jgi:hypothetical protein
MAYPDIVTYQSTIGPARFKKCSVADRVIKIVFRTISESMEMVVEAFGATFLPDAAIVYATPQRRRVRSMVIVYPDYAGFQIRRHPMSTCNVASANGSRKSERKIVGESQTVEFVRETRHDGKGAKHL